MMSAQLSYPVIKSTSIFSRNVAVETANAPYFVAFGTLDIHARQAVSIICVQIRPNPTKIVVFGHEDSLHILAGQSNRSRLGTVIPRVIGRAQAFAIETHPIGIALIGTAFDSADPRERSRAYQISIIAWECNILARKNAEGVFVAYFDSQSFAAGTAHGSVASEGKLGGSAASEDQSWAKAAWVLSSGLARHVDEQGVKAFGCEVGVCAYVVVIDFD